MRKAVYRLLTAAAAVLMMASLTACGGSSGGGKEAVVPTVPEKMNDGTYHGKSSNFDADEDGNGAGYGEVDVTIEGNKITDCTFTMYELDGTVKDESYGADLNQENRLRAQKAVQSGARYAAQLAETGSPESVDAISGATLSYKEFMEAVDAALKEASAD